MKRFAERDHVRTPDDVVQRSQVCVTVRVVFHRRDGVHVLTGPLLKRLSRGVLTGRRNRKCNRQQDEII